jgi:hypothetical protein
MMNRIKYTYQAKQREKLILTIDRSREKEEPTPTT